MLDVYSFKRILKFVKFLKKYSTVFAGVHNKIKKITSFMQALELFCNSYCKNVVSNVITQFVLCFEKI
jgi:hypothetical protein